MSDFSRNLHVWLLSVRAGSGSDKFVERLSDGLEKLGVSCTTTWLPRRAEFAPWTVPRPRPRGRPDIVHVNTWLHPRFIPRGLPVVATAHLCVHAEDYNRYKPLAAKFYHRLWIREIERKTISTASRVVSVSKFTADGYRRVFGIDSDVIYNGIDTSIFFPADKISPGTHFTLLFAGNLTTRKGAELLRPIMDRLGENFSLMVASGNRGINSEYLPNKSELITTANTDRQMAEVYRRAAAVLLPTRLEGLPLVVQEAMACGLPVIASRIPPLVEALGENEDCGILCDVDDVAQFVKAAERLASSPEQAAAMGRRARKRAESLFSVERMASEYVKTYKDLLEKAHERVHRA